MNYDIVRFSKKILSDYPILTKMLYEFYCNIWRYDPNFAEYKKCPYCGKFFSQYQVENQEIDYCTGSLEYPHQHTKLEEAWTPEIVQTNLQPMLDLNEDFYGAVAIEEETGQIIGFVWGYAIPFNVLSKEWKSEIIKKILLAYPNIENKKVAYFQEIATSPGRRNKGVGSALVSALTCWMRTNYPHAVGLLHTHKNSKAFKIFNTVGFRLFAETSQINPNRILMLVDRCHLLYPEALVR